MLAAALTAGLLTSGGATLGPEKLAWLALVVLLSADLPTIPTGATVSATAVLAGHGPLRLLAVVGFATAGAWAGDVATLLLLEWGAGGSSAGSSSGSAARVVARPGSVRRCRRTACGC